jgi:type VI protein secretion system component Hcp
MITVLGSWLMPAARRPRRLRPTAQPLVEALETRTVLSISITANIGGVMPPVVSLTIPQPTNSRVQKISLVVKLSSADQQLFRDAATGKNLHNVSITLSDGENGTDTIDLNDAFITSYRLMASPDQEGVDVGLTLEGLTTQTGSISADIGGVMPHVVSLTIPQSNASDSREQDSSPQQISLVAKLSPGVSKLFQGAESGKVIPEADITLHEIGNSSTETISLTGVFISSIQFVGATEVPELEFSLISRQETIQNS